MGIYMRRFLFAAALSGSLSVVFCAVSSAGQQSGGAMINEQGARVVILKNPSSKTNAQFSSEMAKCESLSRTHMDERVNFYSGCMIYLGNLAQLDGRIVDKAALTPRSTPESVAKRDRSLTKGTNRRRPKRIRAAYPVARGAHSNRASASSSALTSPPIPRGAATNRKREPSLSPTPCDFYRTLSSPSRPCRPFRRRRPASREHRSSAGRRSSLRS